jgi:hypothetical protein
MTLRLAVLVTSLAVVLLAGELPRGVSRLLGGELAGAAGVDLRAYRASALSKLLPIDAGPFGSDSRVTAQYVLWADSPKGPVELSISSGVVPMAKDPDREREGFRYWDLDKGTLLCLIGQSLHLAGDPESVKEGEQRYRRNEPASASIVSLNARYDLWIFSTDASRVFAALSEPSDQRLREFAKRVRKLSGGVTLDQNIQASITAETNSSADAFALTAIAKLFPSIARLQLREEPFASMVDAIENYRVTPDGNAVRIRFTVSEARLAEIAVRQTP